MTHNTIVLLLIAALVIVLAFFFLKKNSAGKQQPRQKNRKVQTVAASVAHTASRKQTTVPQKVVREDPKTLLLRSWEFIIRITEEVAQKFSPADKKMVFSQGVILLEMEMAYRHDVKSSLAGPSASITAPGFEKKASPDV